MNENKIVQQELNKFSNIILLVVTHWGRIMHICISKLIIIDSDNGLLPVRRQAIIWSNAGILLIRALEQTSFNRKHLNMSSGKHSNFVSASMC